MNFIQIQIELAICIIISILCLRFASAFDRLGVMLTFHWARPSIHYPHHCPNRTTRTVRWRYVALESMPHHGMQSCVLFPSARFSLLFVIWCLPFWNRVMNKFEWNEGKKWNSPSRIAFNRSFRVSSIVGRIFFVCVSFAGVISFPPADPLFKSPLSNGLKLLPDGLWSKIGGGGGGGGGATFFGGDCFGDNCNFKIIVYCLYLTSLQSLR